MVTCNRSLTRSSGATTVFEIAAAVPPAARSFKKDVTTSEFMILTVIVLFYNSQHSFHVYLILFKEYFVG